MAEHYVHGNLIEAIERGVAALGKSPDNVSTDDLAPVDEFRIGGRRASIAFLDQPGLDPDVRVLGGEIFRVLKPGGSFGIYDVMRIGPGELSFPVPWASTADTSAVATPEAYRAALTKAGLEIVAERNRHAFALEFFEELKAKVAAAGGPPPLGLHILMGDTARLKVENMLENISAGRIAPVEMIARKRASPPGKPRNRPVSD